MEYRERRTRMFDTATGIEIPRSEWWKPRPPRMSEDLRELVQSLNFHLAHVTASIRAVNTTLDGIRVEVSGINPRTRFDP